jgi:hypothetical protein
MPIQELLLRVHDESTGHACTTCGGRCVGRTARRTKSRKKCDHPSLLPHSRVVSADGSCMYGLCWRCGSPVMRPAVELFKDLPEDNERL